MNIDRFRHRAWILEKQEMRELTDGFDFSTTYVSPDLKPVLEIYPDCERYIIGEECFLMQCTGLKDSEGALIWEADILTFIPEEGSPPGGGTSWVRLELAFDDSYADYYFVNSPDWIKDNSFFAMLEHCNYYRVEGNVYQNPELLEVKG